MKRTLLLILRGGVLALLAALTVCCAAYRLSPEASPELSDTRPFSQILRAAVDESITSLRSSVEGAGQAAGSTLRSVVADKVAHAEKTGSQTESGEEIWKVDVPAGVVPVVRSAISSQTGGMSTTEDLLCAINEAEGVHAVEQEDGSVEIEVPEGLYNEYREKLEGLLAPN
mgnify:CR=1 FL=1